MPEKENKVVVDQQEDETSPPSAKRICCDDPSEYRPEVKDMSLGKDQDDFRVFYKEDNERYPLIRETYYQMHKNQTYEFVQERIRKWGKLNHAKMTIMEAVHRLDDLVDASDPDTSLPNSVHLFQTAERIREAHPDKEWFHLTGLIHDLGKMVALFEDREPQWAAVGDTFPVGCAFSKKCVFPEFFEHNPDHHNPKYNSQYGIYKPQCGLNNISMSFGHDEYMYRVLTGNNCTLPEEGLYCVRFHSFYPWHTGGDYDYLCNDKDREMMKCIREFNKFDLYSKADVLPDVKAITPYYQSLIDKYIPGVLNW